MNSVNKLLKSNIYKEVLIAFFGFFVLNNLVNAQKSSSKLETYRPLVVHTKKESGETDWEYLQRTNRHVGIIDSTAKKDKGYFNIYRIQDESRKNKMQLAIDFLDKYPEHDHYDEVMRMLFYENFHPYFIQGSIPDSLSYYINSKGGSLLREELTSASRALPIDKHAREQYLAKTSDLVAKILNSNASLERKYKAEFMLLCRDIITAIRVFNLLPKNKNPMEFDFWKRFDIQFWDSFKWRMEMLLNKYGKIEQIADDFKMILNVIQDKSSAAGYTYWKYFFDISSPNKQNADQAGIMKLHDISTENVVVLNTLKGFDDTKPLAMSFTAMDGTEVNLANMRGKVILVDFWSLGCRACILEMPHVKTLFDKYREQGFEVIGIAANSDDNREQVLKLLEKIGADWPQRLDKSKDATVSYHSLYGISSLPTVWLLDKEGKIVDRNARGARLEPLIRKYLGLVN